MRHGLRAGGRGAFEERRRFRRTAERAFAGDCEAVPGRGESFYRHGSGFPAETRSGLPLLVRRDVSVSGAARRSGLRPAGAVPRENPREKAGGESGVLHDGGAAGACPGAGSGACLPGRNCCGLRLRRDGLGPEAHAEHAFPGTERKHDGLQSRVPPPHAGNGADAPRRPRQGSDRHVCAAPAPGEPGHFGDLLREAAAGRDDGEAARGV